MFHVNDEPESKFLYTETIKLCCIVLYCMVKKGQENPDWEAVTGSLTPDTI